LPHIGAVLQCSDPCGVVPQCAPFTEPVKSAVRGATDPAEVLVFAAPEA
jgi:hypothetical protein